MREADKYDVLALGSGASGKLVAWSMAKEGKSDGGCRTEAHWWIMCECSVLADHSTLLRAAALWG